MKVRELLSQKARAVYTIASRQSVEDAIHLMTAKKTGALIVTESDHPIGIFAERDVFRAHIRDKTAAFSEIQLKDAVTHELFIANAEDEVDAVLSVMVRSDIEHLPVMADNKILGIFTLNDLIERQIDALTSELHLLKDYINDLHDAGQD